MESKTFAQEVHKKVVRQFPKRKVITSGVDDIWAIDLLDVQNLKKMNSNYGFLLCVIDLFSKYAWVIPIKTKSEKNVLDAFKTIQHYPSNLWCDEGKEFYNKCDEGKEFYNKSFKKFCEDGHINMYHTNTGLKSVFVERFNRTLREKINFYTTEHNTNRYIDALPQIVKEYNDTINSSTKEKPIDIYNKKVSPHPILLSLPTDKNDEKFKIGDYVRIATNIKTFEKKTSQNNWSYDVYKIFKIDNSVEPIVYYLQNMEGQKIQTLFYAEELQKTKIPFYTRKINGS